MQYVNRFDIRILARGTGISLVSRLFGRAVGVLTQVYLARVLGAALFGLYSLGYTLLRMAEIIIPLGLDQAVLRFSRQKSESDRPRTSMVIRQALIIGAITGAIFGAGTLLVAPSIAIRVFEDSRLVVVLRWIAFAIVGIGIFQIGVSASRLSKDMRFAAITQDILQPLSNIALASIMLAIGWGLSGALVSLVASYILATILIVVILQRLFPDFLKLFSSPAVKISDLLRFSIPASVARIFASSIMMFDRMFVGMFLSMRDVGIYQSASLAATIFPIILYSINAILGPMIADYHHGGMRDRLDDVYKLATRWGITLGLPGLILLLVMPGEVLHIIFGGEYGIGSIPLSILAIAQFINLSVGGVGVMLTLTGNQNIWARLTVISFALQVCLSLVLIPRYELIGAAVASGLAIALLFLIGLFYVHKREGYWPYDRKIVKPFIAGATTGIALFIGRFIFPGSTHWHLIGIALICLAIYPLMIWFLGIETEDVEVLKIMHRGIRNTVSPAEEQQE
jgi:O-antigen/teichoic acid export membrane protein